MTMTTDATDARPEAHVSPIYVHVDDPGLLAIDGPDCRAYVTLNAGRSITLFFDDPLALAVRLRDLAADLEAYAQVDAA